MISQLSKAAVRVRCNCELCGDVNRDPFCGRGGRRNFFSGFAKALDMKFDRLSNECHDFIAGFTDRDAPGQIGNIRTEACLALLDDNHVFSVHRFSPACLRMLFNVPGGRSMLSLPATVTVPGFELCRN